MIESLLTKYRSAILVGIGLPAGFLLDGALRLRRRAREILSAAPEKHEARVAEIQEQVRRWAADPDRKPMCTDRRTWQNLSTRFAPKHEWHQIRMGGLDNILQLDEEAGTLRVEPFVTVGQATRYLEKRGYMLAVHLEIEDATLGGLALAAGMTTHSHKAGMLFETVSAWDVVLGDGRLARATETSEPDLFRALPWSHGTLGLLVALELRVIPAKKYVRLHYQPIEGQKRYTALLEQLSTAPHAPHFIEATLFDKHRAVVMTGELTDGRPGERPTRIGRWHRPWFFKHVEGYLYKGDGEELVPLADYLHRHNRSIFWVAADMIPEGNHPLFRLALGWLMPPRIAFLKLSTTAAVRKMTFTLQVFQDIVLPIGAMARAVNRADELFGMYPLLIYPSKITDRGGGQLRAPADQLPGENFGMYFDLGIYGVPRAIREGRRFATVHAMRKMEEFTREVGGYPFLYADTFMTRAEFERMFDLTLYRRVREAYGADRAFPDLYDKIKPEVDVFAVLDEELAVQATSPIRRQTSKEPQVQTY
jgi:Delta24-sterol reductase